MPKVETHVKSSALRCVRLTGMSPGPRARRRDDVSQRILEIGRLHLTEHGAAALSLRAVARDLGMVSSAVYRYVADRDALLTLLVVDAYDEVGDLVDATLVRESRKRWDARLLAICRTVRGWALAEPARYALIYGSPVPGYAAPAETTVAPGTRIVLAILALLAEGVAVGDVHPDGRVALPRALGTDLRRASRELELDLADGVLGRGVLFWSTLFGTVSLEVFGQLGSDSFTEPALLFDHQIRLALTTLRGD